MRNQIIQMYQICWQRGNSRYKYCICTSYSLICGIWELNAVGLSLWLCLWQLAATLAGTFFPLTIFMWQSCLFSGPPTSVLFLGCNSKPSFQWGLPSAVIRESLVPVNRLLMDTSGRASRQAEGVPGVLGMEVSWGCRQVLGGQTGCSFGCCWSKKPGMRGVWRGLELIWVWVGHRELPQTIWQLSEAAQVLVLAKWTQGSSEKHPQPGVD